jgi:putative hydrolase of the HAD superfamily
MIKAVIFDWGGVVAPIRGGGWLEAFGHLTELDGDELKSVWRYAYDGLGAGLISLDEFWRRVEEKTGESYPDRKNNIWEEGLVGDSWPEMLTYASDLRARGIVTAVLSNTIEYLETLPWFLTAYNDFSPVILSHRVGLAKPDPKIFELMLNKLGFQAGECVFVDDMEKNLVPAKELGMAVVLASRDPAKTIEMIDTFVSIE